MSRRRLSPVGHVAPGVKEARARTKLFGPGAKDAFRGSRVEQYLQTRAVLDQVHDHLDGARAFARQEMANRQQAQQMMAQPPAGPAMKRR